MSTNDVLIPPLDTAVNRQPNENEMLGYHFQAESSSSRLIFETKDFFF